MRLINALYGTPPILDSITQFCAPHFDVLADLSAFFEELHISPVIQALQSLTHIVTTAVVEELNMLVPSAFVVNQFMQKSDEFSVLCHLNEIIKEIQDQDFGTSDGRILDIFYAALLTVEMSLGTESPVYLSLCAVFIRTLHVFWAVGPIGALSAAEYPDFLKNTAFNTLFKNQAYFPKPLFTDHIQQSFRKEFVGPIFEISATAIEPAKKLEGIYLEHRILEGEDLPRHVEYALNDTGVRNVTKMPRTGSFDISRRERKDFSLEDCVLFFHAQFDDILMRYNSNLLQHGSTLEQTRRFITDFFLLRSTFHTLRAIDELVQLEMENRTALDRRFINTVPLLGYPVPQCLELSFVLNTNEERCELFDYRNCVIDVIHPSDSILLNTEVIRGYSRALLWMMRMSHTLKRIDVINNRNICFFELPRGESKAARFLRVELDICPRIWHLKQIMRTFVHGLQSFLLTRVYGRIAIEFDELFNEKSVLSIIKKHNELVAKLKHDLFLTKGTKKVNTLISRTLDQVSAFGTILITAIDETFTNFFADYFQKFEDGAFEARLWRHHTRNSLHLIDSVTEHTTHISVTYVELEPKLSPLIEKFKLGVGHFVTVLKAAAQTVMLPFVDDLLSSMTHEHFWDDFCDVV
ncbi:hypothetical protein PCE1_001175 [Barthelona sp. PCE]